MNIVELLVQDHKHVADLFAQYKTETEGPTKHDILNVIVHSLYTHMQAEEEIVYPELAKIDKTESEHAAQEHAAVKLIIEEMDMAPPQTHATFVALLEDRVTHHVEEEETDTLPALEKALSAEELDALGQRFAERTGK